MFEKCSGPTIRQYVVILTANLNMVCLGLNIAWASPMLVKLQDGTGTGLPRPITDEEGSWIVSIGILCGLPIHCTIGLIMDKIGRRTCLVCGCIPRLAVGLLLMFAPTLWVVLLARIIDGMVTNAMVISVVPTYSSEVASKEIRGALGTTSQVASATGMLIFFAVAPFIPYFYVNVMFTCIVVATSLPMWFLPESPYYLYYKGRKEESLKVLTYLRGSEDLAQEEIKQYETLNESATNLSKREVFKHPVTLKTLLKVLLLSILLELTGYNAVLLYMMTILQSTQTTVNDNMASVANGCIQLIACFCTILMTDKFGRKPILVTTLFGMAIGMVGLGVFFHLKQEQYEISGALNFLPLVSMMLVIFCFNSGLGSLFWIVIAELFDGPARAVGVSLASFTATVVIFLTTKYFVPLITFIGPALIYWWFGIFCVVTGLFILFCIPETKGKTFLEIQMELGRNIKAKL